MVVLSTEQGAGCQHLRPFILAKSRILSTVFSIQTKCVRSRSAHTRAPSKREQTNSYDTLDKHTHRDGAQSRESAWPTYACHKGASNPGSPPPHPPTPHFLPTLRLRIKNKG